MIAPRSDRAYTRLHGLRAADAAGLLSLSSARSTGTLIGLYDAVEAGMEDSGFMLVCEDHGTCVGHETLTAARRWMPAPEDWCPVCRGDGDYES